MFLDFEKDRITITFGVDAKIKENEYSIKIYAKNISENLQKKLVAKTKTYPLKKGKENEHYLDIGYVFYIEVAKKIAGNSYLPNQIEFSFGILIGDKETKVNGEFKVHFVRYIPKIMDIKGWVNGAKLQRIWFTKGKNSDKKNVNPEIDVITWKWITEESTEVKEEYEEFLYDTKNSLGDSNVAWSNSVQKLLQSEIRKMIADGRVVLPTKGNPSTSFGVDSKQIIIGSKGEKMPLYEKYYFSSKSFSGVWDLGKHYLRDSIDDFVAAIGSFNYHVLAKGKLEFVDWGGKPKIGRDNSIRVNVEKLIFYVKDEFEFEDKSKTPENLGYWKITNGGKDIKVEVTEPSNTKEYFHLVNKDYRDYRNDVNMGYDFHLYSTLHEDNTSYLNFYL